VLHLAILAHNLQATQVIAIGDNMEKRKAGRPTKEKGLKVSIYLDAETLKRVSAIAEQQGVTLYKLILNAIKGLIK
jgi:hypothetical protein